MMNERERAALAEAIEYGDRTGLIHSSKISQWQAVLDEAAEHSDAPNPPVDNNDSQKFGYTSAEWRASQAEVDELRARLARTAKAMVARNDINNAVLLCSAIADLR